MRITHNLTAMFTQGQLKVTTDNQSKAMEKLSSGYRINRSGDDAAGLTISETMRHQIRGLTRGDKNIQDGTSWLQVADGALQEVQTMLQRMNELSVQASNDTNTESDRAAIDKELKQLKEQINKIGKETQFNTLQVFDNDHASLEIDGVPGDLNIFNASYDAATGKVEYGGFWFKGTRIQWNEIASDMVSINSNGEQVFKEGSYTFEPTINGHKYQFTVTCEEGAKVPQLTRTIDVKADADTGIIIDGTTYAWSKLLDEDGNAASASNAHDGVWEMDFEGAKLGFSFPTTVSSLKEMADAINDACQSNIDYHIESSYIGEQPVTAVIVDAIKTIRVSSSVADDIASGRTSYTVRAGDGTNGQDGIWLEDKDGNTVNGSFKSWSDLGITNWLTGSDISSLKTYTYADNDGTDDTYISFDFNLSDITSKDSVIDGLDGMIIGGGNVKTSYEAVANFTPDSNIKTASAVINSKVSFEEEQLLNRNFDSQTATVSTATTAYDSSGKEVSLNFGNVIVYSGDTTAQEKTLLADMSTYAELILNQKQNLALEGQSTTGIDLTGVKLEDIVGTSNVTTSGYFDDVLTINSSQLNMTDGATYYSPGTDGKTYPTAYIDFANLGASYDLDDLVGLGFNTTCKTCSNHYSIKFATNATDSVTSDGFAYSAKQEGNNYTVLIDINSLKANNVDTGQELADAIISIASESMDFHYTQYAAEGSTLYVYDNRSQNVGTTAATFDTEPFPAVDETQLEFSLKTTDGRQMELNYTYNFNDLQDNIKVNMTSATDGTYVQLADGTYEVYDSNNAAHQSLQRYNMETSFEDANGTTYATLEDMIMAYRDDAVNNMLTSATVNLNATDYTYMLTAGRAQGNIAIRSIFDAEVIHEDSDGLYIQGSDQEGDGVFIDRFKLNTLELGIHRVGCKTYDEAQASITAVQKAIDKVSDRRSFYGAWSNRLEHMSKNALNMRENVQSAESRIRDTDMADTMVEYSKQNILSQVGQSILAQANQSTQGVVSLLQ